MAKQAHSFRFFGSTGLSAALAIVVLTGITESRVAFAQTVDTSEWVCEYCPFESGHRADYDVGASVVSDDSAYFGDASGYDEEGAYANVDGEGTYASESHRIMWSVEDLGLDSRVAELDGGRPGVFGYRISWRELPRRQFITTDSIFVAAGDDMLGLPAGWVNAGSTAGFTELDTSLSRQDIESDRSTLEVGGKYLALNRFDFDVNFRHQEWDGVDVVGGSNFSTSSLLPARFDYASDEFDVSIRYQLDRGSIALSWYLSDFDGGGSSLTWETPFTSSPGAEFSELARPPDNEFSLLTLSGGYRFDTWTTNLGFSASVGQIEQDAALLGYTTNSNLTTDPLPRNSLDGDIDINRFALTVTTRPIDKARVRFSARYDERDNGTPSETWNRVITDTFLSGDPEMNLPYSYERTNLEVSGDYALFDNLRLSAGYEHKETDRDLQEVAEQSEDIGWGRVRWQPNSLIDLEVKAGTAKRDIDRLDESLLSMQDQNPLMRKYDVAYRYREFGELTLNASLPNFPLGFTLSGVLADDSYTKSELGLVSGEDIRVALDISWTVSEKAFVYLNTGFENIEADQLGSESFAASDWRATTDDDFVSVGAGFRVHGIADKIDLQLDYLHSDGTSEIAVDSVAMGLSQFPDLETTLDNLRIRASFQYSERLEIAGSLRYQDFSAEDWALEGVTPDTILPVLGLGAKPYDEDQLVFGLSFSYRVGGSDDGSADP